MADVTVTVGVDASQATAAMAQIDQQLLSKGRQISEALSSGVIPPGGRALMSPEDLRALEAYEASIKKVSAATEEAGKSSQRAGINFDAMAERMVARLVILETVRIVIEQIKDAILECANAESNFVHIEEITQQTNQETQKTFADLKAIANATGQDLNKVVAPAFIQLTQAGFDVREATEYTNVFMAALEKTGINALDAGIKAREGAAGFQDLTKAFAALGMPDAAKWAQSWIQAQAAERVYEQGLERMHELEQRAFQDAERLAGAHEEFASATGLAGAAFKAFQQVQTSTRGGIAPYVTIPKALADLPGGQQAFGQLLGEMQKRYAQGMDQIAREEHLPAALVRAGVGAGIAGFDERSLLAAQKRAVEEQNIDKTRKVQDERYERTKAFEDARVNANTLVTQAMQNQVAAAKDLDKVLATVNGHLQQASNSWNDMRMGAGEVTRSIGQALVAHPIDFFGWMRGGGGGAPAPATSPAPASSPANPIVEKLNELMNMLRGHA